MTSYIHSKGLLVDIHDASAVAHILRTLDIIGDEGYGLHHILDRCCALLRIVSRLLEQ